MENFLLTFGYHELEFNEAERLESEDMVILSERGGARWDITADISF